MYTNLSRIHHASTPDGGLGETWLMDGRVLRTGPPHAELLAAAVADLEALKRVAKDCSAPSTQVLGRQLIREAEGLLEKIRTFTPETAGQLDAHAADLGAMPRKLAAALLKDQQEGARAAHAKGAGPGGAGAIPQPSRGAPEASGHVHAETAHGKSGADQGATRKGKFAKSRVFATGGRPMFLKDGKVVSNSKTPDMVLISSTYRVVRSGVDSSSESDSSSDSDWR